MRDRSNESRGHGSPSPRRERRGHLSATLDAMNRALRRVARSPFFKEIEHTKMSRHFTHLSFICYYGKTDPIENVCHFTQLMALYSRNDGLWCKVFPSSLGPTVIRWFNALSKGSIQAFKARFVTCSRVPQPINALLSMKMGSGETL